MQYHEFKIKLNTNNVLICSVTVFYQVQGRRRVITLCLPLVDIDFVFTENGNRCTTNQVLYLYCVNCTLILSAYQSFVWAKLNDVVTESVGDSNHCHKASDTMFVIDKTKCSDINIVNMARGYVVTILFSTAFDTFRRYRQRCNIGVFMYNRFSQSLVVASCTA